ncbi:hypothetical protein Bhyg_15434, partial [Pseudolycoriella hygida]
NIIKHSEAVPNTKLLFICEDQLNMTARLSLTLKFNTAWD